MSEMEEDIKVLEEADSKDGESDELNLEDSDYDIKDDKDDKEDKDDKDDKEDKDDDLEDKFEIDETEFGIRPSFKDITTKFPTLLKEFPQIRDMYFREQKLTEVFPTVEEAQEAREDLESFKLLESNLKSGKVEDLSNTLSAIKDLGEDTLINMAINFLPSLQKLDQNAYYSATTPIVLDIVRSLYDAGIKNGNENLKNTGLAAALYFFGDKDVASGAKTVNLPKTKVQEDKKDDALENERRQFSQERYSSLLSDVNTDYISEISSAIQDGIDPDGIMTKFLKEALTEKIIKSINQVLSADTNHQSKMKSLWKQAESSKFSRDWKDRIKFAALSRAKSIMPTIRNKARAEALNTKENNGKRVSENVGKSVKIEGQRSGSVRTISNSSMSKIGSINPNKIDYKKTSDMDILQGKVTLKS